MAKRDGAAAAAKKKWYQFWVAKNMQIDANADPEVLLRQAMGNAQDQSRKLELAAADVMANQQLAVMKLTEMMKEEDKIEAKLEAAVALMDAEQNPAKRQQLEQAVITLSTSLDRLAPQIEQQQTFVEKAAAAVDQVKGAVAANQRELAAAGATQQELKAANAQAAAQESLNNAMASINDTVGDGITPTLASVRDSINTRYAKATAITQLRHDPAKDAMAAIDAAAETGSASARIAAIRAKNNGELSAPAAPLAIASATDVVDTTAVDETNVTPIRRFDPTAL